VKNSKKNKVVAFPRKESDLVKRMHEQQNERRIKRAKEDSAALERVNSIVSKLLQKKDR